MQHYSRFCAAVVSLAFFVSCSSAHEPAFPERLLDHFVAVRGQEMGIDRTGGMGIVYKHDDEKQQTYIVSARHILLRALPVASPLLPFPLTVKAWWTPAIRVGDKAQAAEIVWDDEELDAVILRTARIDLPVVEFLQKEPPWGAKAVLVGRFTPREVTLFFEGRVQRPSRSQQVFSVHGHQGCSGGGIFVYTEDGWKLSALSSMIGMQDNGAFLYHLVFGTPFYMIADAVDPKRTSKPCDPLQDYLQEF